MSLTVHCPAFPDHGAIPRRHAGDGEDLSPPLTWSHLPTGTRELALIIDDPDAPSQEPWVHWVIYGIPATTLALAEGVHAAPHPPFPEGAAQGINSWGTSGYRGPAPPRGHGVHHYHIRLFAIDTALRLPPGLDSRALMNALSGHVLGNGEYVGTYERAK